jgi:signal transduction histidine kinase
MWRRYGQTALRYSIAVAAVGLTIPIKMILQQWMEVGAENEREAPFILSLAAVMVSGWYGGLGPGLLATALAGFSGSYFFMHPFYDFTPGTTPQRLRLVLFLIEGSLISVLCHTLKSAQRRAEANELEARDLQRQLLDITDTEQRRIGHDLHDGLGQHLTGIAFMSKLIEQRLAAKQHPEADAAHKIARLVNKAIGWTRDLARGLAPVDLEREEGLASALRQLTESTGEMYGANCRFEVAGEIPVQDMTAAIHLYRIAQEALNNAIRHGRPKSIVVRLTRQIQRIAISVEDDGRGFDPAAPYRHDLESPTSAGVKLGGMGLRIMSYRAKMIGGKLEVRSRPGGGTVVTCTCPLPATTDHAAAPAPASASPQSSVTEVEHAAHRNHEQLEPFIQRNDHPRPQGQGLAR